MAPHALARSVLRVGGEDAGPFLDALVTNDVSRATSDAPVYAALLSPQGKVVADFVAWRASDGALLLDVAESRAADLLRRLTAYRLRRKVTLEDVSAGWRVLADPEGHGPPDPRRLDGALGARWLAEHPPIESEPLARHDALRIRAGAPDLALDARPEEVFALEGLLEEFNGVDFQKGCFIGQENVSRMKRRATTRRKFCRIAFEGPPPPFGAPVTAGTAEIGDVRSGVEDCAIALVRLDRAREAVDKGVPLTASGRPVRLDPPDWLILPASGDD